MIGYRDVPIIQNDHTDLLLAVSLIVAILTAAFLRGIFGK